MLLLGLVALGAILHSRCFSDVPIDDAFVTFRHSLHLVHGDGYSCNRGTLIEGTSSALFAFLMVPIIAVGADPFRVATELGVAAFVVTTILAYLVVRELVDGSRSRSFAIAAATLVAASSPLAYHSRTGMETTLFAALILAAVWRFSRHVQRADDSVSWAVILGVAAVTRTEAALYFLGWLVLGSFIGVARRRASAAARAFVAFGATYLPWVVFRWVYFGQLLPNSVIAKSGWFAPALASGNWRALIELANGTGTRLLVDYAEEHWLLLLATLGTLFVRRALGVVWPLLVLLVGATALVSWSGGDWMPYYRHFVPSIAPLCVAACVGLSGLLFHDEQRGRYGHASSALIGLAIFLLSLRTNAARRETLELARWEVASLRKLGERLAKLTSSNDWVVSDMAGILPYYWDANTIDVDGFCDAHIAVRGQAQRFGTGRSLPEYVATRAPEWYAFQYPEGAVKLYREPAFVPHRDEYYLVRFPYGYLKQERGSTPVPTLLVRKTNADEPRILAALGREVTLVELGSELRRVGWVRSDEAP